MHRALPPLAAALLLSAAACDDPTELTATSPVVFDTLTVYALNGTDFTLPSALNILSAVAVLEPTVVRATGSFSFDIGFDINTAGDVVLYPMYLLASDLADVHAVGLQKVSATFDQLTRAPESGYNFDSTLVVVPGDVVAVQVAAPAFCGFPFPETIFAKLTVDSLNTQSRRIFFRTTVDTSCGFRSFLPGIPSE